MFPDEHGWTDNAVGSFSDAGGPFIVNNDRSYKIVSNGKGAASVATSPTLAETDLTDSHVAFHSQVSFSSRLQAVRLRLSSANIATDYAEATIWEDGEDSIALGSSFEFQTVPVESFQVVGSIEWSAINRAQILLTDNGTGSTTLYVAGIYAVPVERQAIVSFAFDDGHASVLNPALRKLSGYRYPATAYVIVDVLGEEGWLGLEDLYFLRQQHRWEIAGHAFTLANHNLPNGFDDLEGEELEAELDGLRNWLDERGFRRDSFAYPKGAAGLEVRRLIERDYRLGRVTAAGPETRPTRDDYTLRGWSIDSETDTAEAIEAALDAAVEAGTWLILTFHNIVSGEPEAATDFNLGDFEQIVDHVAALQQEGAGLEVLTVADAWRTWAA
jgi:hypothetical protein